MPIESARDRQSATMESASASTPAGSGQHQVHKKRLAAKVDIQQQQHKRCGSLSRATTHHHHHVWLLSIMSLIFIAAMLASDCQARAFMGTSGAGADTNGIGAAGGESSGFNIQQLVGAVASGDKYNRQVDSSALEYVLEMSCRNLVESLFQPRSSRAGDLRGIVDYLDYADLDGRLKRASPKHTPRFGR